MSKFNVTAMIPLSMTVEAENWEEAIEVFFDESGEASWYEGDGIHVIDLDTDEEFYDY